MSSSNALRHAAQQALPLLEFVSQATTKQFGVPLEVVDALRAALAEPVQEPVAWRTFDGDGGHDYRTYEDNEDYAAEWAKRNPRHVGWVEPLYTAPPQRKPLTDEEILRIKGQFRGTLDVQFVDFARAIERAHEICE